MNQSDSHSFLSSAFLGLAFSGLALPLCAGESPKLKDFMQIDASIDPGNSRGALADAAGRLVGIHSAI